MTRDRDGRTGDLEAGAAPRRILAGLVRRIRGRDPGPVHLYLDVSGSVEPFLEPLHAAVRGVARLIWRHVHLFSTDVVDAPVRDLAEHSCQTTGGTSIVAVARHIRANGVCRAVIVTDGQVGPIGARDRETLGETFLGVALTSGRERGGELARLARHVVVLPGEESGNGTSARAAKRKDRR